ncbi:MAG: hypothetical protein KGZ34_03740 [Nitrosarchaeum sp.]|nr:hypothetical protein [Nitrosarchaeum sp.]
MKINIKKINKNKINTISQYALLTAQIFIFIFPFLTQTFGSAVNPPLFP